MNEKYADMLDLPHYQSKTRQHMSIYDRAAQFAPFAALTGHEEAIEETAVENLARMEALAHGEEFVEPI